MECYTRVVARLENFFATQLARLGVACAKNPRICIAVFITACSVAFAGASQIQTENSAQAIWIDPNSIPKGIATYYETTFNATTDIGTLVIKSKNDAPGVNIITKAFFEEVFDLHEAIAAQVSEVGGKNLDAICTRGAFGQCLSLGGLQAWSFDRATFNATVSNDTELGQILTLDTFPDLSTPEYTEIFGEYEVVGGLARARALTITYIVEKFVDGSEEITASWLDGFVELVNFQFSYSLADGVGFANAALDQELEGGVVNDIVLLIIAFNSMIIFTTFTLGVPCSNTRGRSLVVSADVASLAFAGAAGYGLMMWFGVPFTALVQIAPFILLGIGIDNAFVIAGAFDRTDESLPVDERVRLTMLSAGMSVTATTLTDVAALYLGSLTRLPAVQYFCYYTGTAILAIYLEHITVFIAYLALDAKRREAERRDCTVCIKFSESEKEQEANFVRKDSRLSKFLYEKFGPFILNKKVRVVIILFFLGIGGLSGWAITMVSRDFKLEDLVADTSFVGDYFRTNREIFGSSFPPSSPVLLTKDIDYADHDNNLEITRLIETITNASCIQREKVPLSWHEAFHAFARSTFNSSFLTPDGQYYANPDIASVIKTFISSGPNQRFAPSIVLDDAETSIVAAQISFKHILMDAAPIQIECLLQMQDIFLGSTLDPQPAIHSPEYVFFDQYRIILPEMIQNLGLALAAVVVVCLFLLVHPVSVLIMTVVILSIFLWLLASIPLWGLDLNSISAINLIMAIGLVVDYSLHLIHSFGLKPYEAGRKERTLLALKSIGPAVLLGLTTTFLGVLPIAFASSKVFRVFFQMFLSIVVVGGLHGFFLLPVLLSLFGPNTDVIIKVNDEVKEGKVSPAI